MKVVKLMMAVILAGMVFLSGGAKNLLGKAACAAESHEHGGIEHEGASCG